MIESKMKKDFYIDENKQKNEDLLYKMVNKDPWQIENIENKIPWMNEYKIKRERLANDLLLKMETFIIDVLEKNLKNEDFESRRKEFFDQLAIDTYYDVDEWVYKWDIFIKKPVYRNWKFDYDIYTTEEELLNIIWEFNDIKSNKLNWIITKIECFLIQKFVRYLMDFFGPRLELFMDSHNDEKDPEI